MHFKLEVVCLRSQLLTTIASYMRDTPPYETDYLHMGETIIKEFWLLQLSSKSLKQQEDFSDSHSQGWEPPASPTSFLSPLSTSEIHS